jgi:hypothetical protein
MLPSRRKVLHFRVEHVAYTFDNDVTCNTNAEEDHDYNSSSNSMEPTTNFVRTMYIVPRHGSSGPSSMELLLPSLFANSRRSGFKHSK